MALPVRRNLIPQPGERCFIPGKTGSGKTTTERILLSFWTASHPAIVIDTKPDTTVFTKWGLRVEKPDEVLDAIEVYPRVVYRPTEYEDAQPETLDALLDDIYHAHAGRYSPLAVCIDETGHVVPGTNAGPGLQNLLTRGREFGLTTIMATQRPARIPLFCYTESDRYYIHRILGTKDRQMMSQHVGWPVPLVEKWKFLYWHEAEDVAPMEWGWQLSRRRAA